MGSRMAMFNRMFVVVGFILTAITTISCTSSLSDSSSNSVITTQQEDGVETATLTSSTTAGAATRNIRQNNHFHFMESTKYRHDFIQHERANQETSHEVMIAIQKQNMEELEEMVLDRASPDSPNYQQWLKYDEITAIVQNPNAYQRVEQWLVENNVTINQVSRRLDYIHAEAPIKKWEELLNAEFYVFLDHSYRLGTSQPDIEPTTFLRCLSYSIPKRLKGDIEAIFHTVQPPIAYHKSFHVKEEDPVHGTPVRTLLRVDPMAWSTTTQVVTIPYLNKYYKIESNLASAALNQSVFQTSTEYFSQDDLNTFQKNYDLTQQRAISIGGHTIAKCPTSTSASQSCFEGNLDIQYIMGIAQQTASIFWYIPRKSGVDSFATWVTKIADDPDPPQSNSMSWGAIEQEVSLSVMKTFNNEATILAGMGVTVLVSTGDYGVSNVKCACSANSGWNATGTDWPFGTKWSGKGYFPSFPATSPWVTAVGATMGTPTGAANGDSVVPAPGKPEIACQSQRGGVITTGGGFSTYYAMPSWQKKSAALYFSRLSSDKYPTPGYNPNGRAYPDVAFSGVDYQVVIGSETFSIFGSSASAPVFAGMITLLNSLRQAAGFPNVGFINPTLYAVGYNNTMGLKNTMGSSVKFNDVTDGVNNCCYASDKTKAVCCNSGFAAIKGWDPVTGWGSIFFPNFAQMFDVSAPYSAASLRISTHGWFTTTLSTSILSLVTYFLF